LDYFQQVAKVASVSKAFYAYDLWSEPHVINWAEIDYIPNAQFCYCPYTLARFREWLKQKYGTLEALNKAWYRGFESWEQVEPPRFATILSYADYMDWRIFMGDKLAQDLASRSRAVKQVDPLHLTTSHAAIPSVFQTLADGTGAPDDYLMKDSVDFYGTSFYPKLTSPSTHWTLARRMLVMDSVKSVTGGRGFYVGELQGGFGVHGVTVSQPIEPHELELYTWGMVARGARAINYYAFYPMSSGYESGGYGLINLDGTLTERSKAAGATAKIISEHADLFLNAKQAPSPVALIYNPLTSLVGGQVFAARMAMRDAIAGYHRIFYERNVSMDIVSAREVTGRSLAQYKLVVAPYPILMTEELAKALEEYVRGGGHLLLEARPGWVDDHGYAQPVIPGLGLEKVTGVREKEVDPVNDFKIRWGDAEFGAASMEEKFTVLDPKATVVAQFADGTPAAYEHSYGAGSAVILGGFAGNYNEKNPVSMNPLGEKLMQWAGIEGPEMKASSPVEVREMISGGKRVVFFFNHGDKSAAVEYTTPVRSVADFQELISGERQKLDRMLKFELPAQSVKVWVYPSVLKR
jgi:beta-galactosidase